MNQFSSESNTPANLPDLSDLRDRLQAIDQEILSLVEKRQDLAEQVGQLKAASGAAVWNPGQEQKKIGTVTKEGPSFLNQAQAALLRRLMELSRLAQYRVLSAETGGIDRVVTEDQFTFTFTFTLPRPLSPLNSVLSLADALGICLTALELVNRECNVWRVSLQFPSANPLGQAYCRMLQEELPDFCPAED